MRTDGESVLATYKFPSERARLRVMNPTQLTPRTSEPALRFKDCVQLASRPDSLEGEYAVRISPRLITHVARRLANRTLRGYTKEKGDVGEELIDAILSQTACPQIMSHPLDPGRDFDSSRKGPDSLRETRSPGIILFEFKWWKDIRAALSDARKEAKEFPHGKVLGERIVGAYIAILEWGNWSEDCNLKLSRAW